METLGQRCRRENIQTAKELMEQYAEKKSRTDIATVISFKLGISRRLANEYMRMVEMENE